jgi:integrase
MKLTKTTVDKMQFTGKDAFYWDEELKGFGLKITRTGKTYIVQARVDNKTIRKKIASVGQLTPDEARKEAKKLLGEMAKGIDINLKEKRAKVQNITLQQAYAVYKDTRPLGIRTITDYDGAMKTTFKEWQNKPIISINREMIERKFKAKSKTAPALANLHFRFLRALLNFAMEKYTVDGKPLIPSNPCARLTILKLWNRIERRDTYIKPAQIKSFFYGLTINDYDKPQIQTAKKQCMFILFTGCRDQEAACLQRRDIDFEDKTVTFKHTKNHHKHVLPLGDWLFQFTKELCEGLAPDAYLFPANNKSGHIKDHRKAIKEIAEECGINFSLHDLRRTFSCIVDHHLGQSFSPYTIKRLLNHTQNDVTAGYIRFGVDDLRRPMQMIEDYILEQAGLKEKPKADNIIAFPNAQ